MLRRSLAALSKRSFPSLSIPKSTGRTIVRDPRKKKAISAVVRREELRPVQQNDLKPLPFAPLEQNQQSFGSSLGSYAVMGVGVALGVTMVGALLG